MKTTVDLDDELLVRAKAASAREQKPLKSLIEEGLRMRLRRHVAVTPRALVPLALFHGTGGLAPGIDPLSNRSLLAAADDDA